MYRGESSATVKSDLYTSIVLLSARERGSLSLVCVVSGNMHACCLLYADCCCWDIHIRAAAAAAATNPLGNTRVRATWETSHTLLYSRDSQNSLLLMQLCIYWTAALYLPSVRSSHFFMVCVCVCIAGIYTHSRHKQLLRCNRNVYFREKKPPIYYSSLFVALRDELLRSN